MPSEYMIGRKERSWVEDYHYMEDILNNESYKPRYKSFTDWLVNYASERGCSRATLWHRLRAGRYYDAYYKRAEEQGRSPIKLEYISINPDCLNNIERIAGDDVGIGDELVEKLVHKEISPKELRLMWHRVKLQREENNEKAGRANSYDKSPLKYYEATKTTDILQALKTSRWLRDNKEYSGKGRYRLLHFFRYDAQMSPLDALAIETGKEGITLHAIDILTEQNYNLDSSARLDTLSGAVNYFWFAVEQEQLAYVEEHIRGMYGILLYNSESGQIKVARYAERFAEKHGSALRNAIFEEIIKSTI